MVRKKAKRLRDKPLREPSGRTQTLTLSERDRREIFAALTNPPRPNERLVRALTEHGRRIAG